MLDTIGALAKTDGPPRGEIGGRDHSVSNGLLGRPLIGGSFVSRRAEAPYPGSSNAVDAVGSEEIQRIRAPQVNRQRCSAAETLVPANSLLAVISIPRTSQHCATQLETARRGTASSRGRAQVSVALLVRGSWVRARRPSVSGLCTCGPRSALSATSTSERAS